MDNNNQTPDNRENSPIRGLFKKNEEAYNKHQREQEEEKQKRLEEERQKQIEEEKLRQAEEEKQRQLEEEKQRIEEEKQRQLEEKRKKAEERSQKRKEPDPPAAAKASQTAEGDEPEKKDTAEDKAAVRPGGSGGKLRSFIGKLREIITQPEDAEFEADDDDEDELTGGIFAWRKKAPADDMIADIVREEKLRSEEVHSPVKAAQPSETAKPAPQPAKTEPENENDYISTSAVLFSAHGDDDEEVIYDASVPEPEKKPGSEPEKPLSEPASEAAPVQPEEPSQPETQETAPAQSSGSGKTEITLETIMKAKEAAILKTPITYIPEQNTLAQNDQPESTGELSHTAQVPKPAEEKPKKNELSHTAQAPKSAEEKQKTHELSHTAQAPKPAEEKQKTHELSHTAPTPKPAEEKPKKNELSHTAPAPKPAEEKPKKNELSHTAPTPKTAEEKPKTHELSHTAPAPKPAEEKPKKNELSHTAPTPKPTEEKPKKNELSHTAPTSKPATDFAEGISEPMVYRHNDSAPFVVMAGKFTATVRKEYENIRRLRKNDPNGGGSSESAVTAEAPPPPAAKPKPKPKPASAKAAEKASDEEPAEEAAQTAKAPKPLELKPPGEKKKFSARIKSIFFAEGDVFDIEDDFVEEKPEIDDYGSEEDADEIRNDINYNFSKVFARTIVLAVTSVFSVAAAVFAQTMPTLFTETLRNGWLVYGIVSFLIMSVAFFAGRYTIVNGIMALRHLKGNSDTAPAVAAAGSAVQAVTALFIPDLYVNGTYHLYSCLAVLALLFNSFGKLLIIKRTADNFRFLCSGKARLAGKIFNDDANANKFCTGLPIHRPLIAYMKKSKFMSNFLHLSYASDPVEDNASFLAPFTTALSLMCGIVYGVMKSDFVGGVNSFAVISFITVPVCCLVALNIPMKNLCSSSLKKGAMVVGYEAVNQFCDTNAIMLESAQLYPKGNIILSGIKSFNESKLNDALLAGASVSFAVGGAMSHVFETIIQDRRHMVPAVDSVSYDDEMGLSGWIGGQRILLGNRELMEKHNIEMPPESVEEKYRRMGNEISYISMSGELIAMFVLTYKVDRAIAHALRELTDNGVSLIVRTIDPNITQEHIAKKFSIYQRCIKILPTGLGTICHNELTGKERSSRAYVATNGRVTAFSAAISGCIRIRSTVTIAKIIQVLAIVLGFLLVSVISFVSGFEKLGGIELLMYTGFWCAALILVSAAARKLT